MKHAKTYLLATTATLMTANLSGASLVKHWTLDGSSPYTEEVTGNSTNTVDVAPGVTSGQAGIAPGGGTSVLFSNNGGGHISAGTVESDGDYVSGSGDGTFTLLSGNYTVSAWINLSADQQIGGDRVAVSSQFNSSTGFLFGVNGGSSNQVFMDFGNASLDSGISLDEEKDYFIAVLRDTTGTNVGGGTNRARIVAYDVAAGTWQTSDTTINRSIRLQNLTIGAVANDLNGREFEGRIDDVRIYDSALSQAELDALVIPEPGSLVLLAMGGLCVIRRRRG